MLTAPFRSRHLREAARALNAVTVRAMWPRVFTPPAFAAVYRG